MAVSNLKNNISIIETGTSGIWTYRKWSDGTAECWGKASQSISGWTAWYSWYYSTPYNITQNFPSGLFIETPSISVEKVSGVAGLILSENPASKTSTSAHYLIRPDAGATDGYELSFYAIGKWR